MWDKSLIVLISAPWKLVNATIPDSVLKSSLVYCNFIRFILVVTDSKSKSLADHVYIILFPQINAIL